MRIHGATSVLCRASCVASDEHCATPHATPRTPQVDITHEHALQWLRGRAGGEGAAQHSPPFFLYVAFTVPHAGGWGHEPDAPEQGAPVPTDGEYASRSAWPEVERDHAAVVTYLDAKFGELMGTLEALDSLASFAYERPGDVFPEILDPPEVRLEAEGLGHPLLPPESCVRNDLRLGGEERLLVVSGSNMSGKSTLLRSVGVNTLLALAGAEALKSLQEYPSILIVGIVLLTGFVNLFVGSASGKWGLLAPIFVPMLMTLGISPDLTQAAYRVGDSSTNIITPLMPYFPLVVVYCQRYVKGTGIGTLAAMMLPYSLWFLASWTVFLLVYYAIGLPLGFAASYTYG